MEKRLIYTVIISAVIATSLFGVAYANESAIMDKEERINELFLEKGDLVNNGQLTYIQMQYSYCTNYQSYLESILFPISGVDKRACFENLENFLEKI